MESVLLSLTTTPVSAFQTTTQIPKHFIRANTVPQALPGLQNKSTINKTGVQGTSSNNIPIHSNTTPQELPGHQSKSTGNEATVQNTRFNSKTVPQLPSDQQSRVTGNKAGVQGTGLNNNAAQPVTSPRLQSGQQDMPDVI
ncbi:hypothetical protein H4R33_006733 [Dimargaris cristalligena]|nr:hypothetical protein H4R33_006733 [Dimargaris cristalligena]